MLRLCTGKYDISLHMTRPNKTPSLYPFHSHDIHKFTPCGENLTRLSIGQLSNYKNPDLLTPRLIACVYAIAKHGLLQSAVLYNNGK